MIGNCDPEAMTSETFHGEMGHAVRDALSSVNIKTDRRWQRDARDGRQPGKPGRSRMTKSLRKLILRLARDNAAWRVSSANMEALAKTVRCAGLGQIGPIAFFRRRR